MITIDTGALVAVVLTGMLFGLIAFIVWVNKP